MRRHGVVLKLFVVTSILIMIVFSFVMLAEGLFFERFYRMSKIHAIEENMNHFAEQYKQVDSNKHQISRLLGEFMNENDTSTSILNSQFEQTNIDPYFLELQTDRQKITIRIPAITLDTLPNGIQIGETLVVDGIFMDENDSIMQLVAIQQKNEDLGQGLTRVEGKITNLMLPEKRSYNPLYQDTLIEEALRDWIPNLEQYESLLQNGSPVQVEWIDNWSGVQYAVLIQSLTGSKNDDRYLFVHDFPATSRRSSRDTHAVFCLFSANHSCAYHYSVVHLLQNCIPSVSYAKPRCSTSCQVRLCRGARDPFER